MPPSSSSEDAVRARRRGGSAAVNDYYNRPLSTPFICSHLTTRALARETSSDLVYVLLSSSAFAGGFVGLSPARRAF